jgi:hypothetical protein
MTPPLLILNGKMIPLPLHQGLDIRSATLSRIFLIPLCTYLLMGKRIGSRKKLVEMTRLWIPIALS